MEAAQAQADISMARNSKGNMAIPMDWALEAAEVNQLVEGYLTSHPTATATINSRSTLAATSPRNRTNLTATKTSEATHHQTEFQAKTRVSHKDKETAALRTQEEQFRLEPPTRSIL